MRLPLLALVALVAAQEPARVPIAWTVKKGQKIRYEFIHKITTNDGTRDTDLQLTIGIGLEGGETAADGTTGLKLTVERIAQSKTAGEEREEYDSARDKAPPEGSYPRVLSKCVGRTLSIRIGPSGTLTALEEIGRASCRERVCSTV